MGEVQLLLDDGNENINADGDPDLGLHRVFRGTIERLDSEVLLDPSEEEFDLPTALV